MAEMLGRKVTISIAGTVVATARTKSLTINNSLINITSDGDDGIQRFLDEMGEKSVEVTLDGLADVAASTATTALMDIALGNSLIDELILDYGAFTLTGQFAQSTYSEGEPYNEAVTFSASYSSSGAVIKAATP